MSDLARRFPENPLLVPEDVTPSADGLRVECLLNPGVFRWGGKICLLVRVAEGAKPARGRVRIPILESGRIEILDLPESEVDTRDPREFKYRGTGYLSTLSHLRVFSSKDGVRFEDTGLRLVGEGALEAFGIEDCRVSTTDDGRFLLTYTAVSENGHGVGLRVTADWKHFDHLGMILPPSNKDAAIFERKVNGNYYCLHRPSGVIVGGHFLWGASSPDLLHWGGHQCIARTRPDCWDSARIGAGAAPVQTMRGWLAIYHGADAESQYRLGSLLLDGDEPWKVIARPTAPIMEPMATYEQNGFFSNVVFTNGHLVDGNEITIYYGAADRVICGARFSLREILRG